MIRSFILMSFDIGIVLIDVALNESIIYVWRKQLECLDYFRKMFHIYKEREMEWIMIKDIPNANTMRRLILDKCSIEIDMMYYMLEDIEDLFQCYRFLCLDINIDPLRYLDIHNVHSFDFFLLILKEFDLIHNPTVRTIIKKYMPLDYDLNNLSKEYKHYLCQHMKPINHRMITFSDSNIIKFWDVQTKNVFHIINEHVKVFCVASAPNGLMYATGDILGNVKIWKMCTCSLLYSLKTDFHYNENSSAEINECIYSMDFSPDNQSLVFCGRGGTKLWHFNTNKIVIHLLGEYEIDQVLIFCCKFSPNGKYIASGSDVGKLIGSANIYLIDAFSTKIVHVFKMSHYAFNVIFSPDNKIIASCDVGGHLYLWDVHTKELLNNIDTFVTNMTFSPDGSKIATTSGSLIRMYDVKSCECLFVCNNYAKQIEHLMFSPDGSIIAGDRDDTIITYDSNTGKLLNILNIDSKTINDIIFYPIFSPIDTKLLKYQVVID